MDGHRKLKLLSSTCKDVDELEKPPLPDRASKNFDKQLFPNVLAGLGSKKPKYEVYSLEVCVANICTLLDVFCDTSTQLLDPPLNCLATRSDLLEISNIAQTRSSPVRIPQPR